MHTIKDILKLTIEGVQLIRLAKLLIAQGVTSFPNTGMTFADL